MHRMPSPPLVMTVPSPKVAEATDPDEVIIVGGDGDAVRLMAGLAADGGKGGVGWRKNRDWWTNRVRDRGNEPVGGVALHALIAARAGRSCRGHGMVGGVPLSPIGLRRGTVVALVASADRVGDIDWPGKLVSPSA